MLATALALLSAEIAPQVAPPPMDAPDVTVTGRRLPNKPIRDAIGYYERHCFDAARLTGQPSLPRRDPDWHALSDAERREYGLADKADPAYAMTQPDGQILVMTLAKAGPERGLIEHRCTLIVSGGDTRVFAARISALIGGAGTQRHVGHVDGLRSMKGWRQQIWTAAPAIGSAHWRAYRSRQPGGSWLVVIDPVFYATMEYVVAELKSRTEGSALSVASLTYTRRARPSD